MAMKAFNLDPGLSSVFLTLLLASSPCAAQIYKWVDANGQTHYAASKEAAGQAKADELKVNARGPSEEEAKASAQSWQIINQGVDQRLADKQRAEKPLTPVAPMPPVAKAPKSLSGAVDDGSNASKCNYAKDVLSGAIVRRNGAPTSAQDRAVAQNDIKYFCPR